MQLFVYLDCHLSLLQRNTLKIEIVNLGLFGTGYSSFLFDVCYVYIKEIVFRCNHLVIDIEKVHQNESCVQKTSTAAFTTLLYH